MLSRNPFAKEVRYLTLIVLWLFVGFLCLVVYFLGRDAVLVVARFVHKGGEGYTLGETLVGPWVLLLIVGFVGYVLYEFVRAALAWARK